MKSPIGTAARKSWRFERTGRQGWPAQFLQRARLCADCWRAGASGGCASTKRSATCKRLPPQVKGAALVLPAFSCCGRARRPRSPRFAEVQLARREIERLAMDASDGPQSACLAVYTRDVFGREGRLRHRERSIPGARQSLTSLRSRAALRRSKTITVTTKRNPDCAQCRRALRPGDHTGSASRLTRPSQSILRRPFDSAPMAGDVA